MSKQYPLNVCTPCGVAANTLTCLKKYNARPLKESFTTSTMAKGFCGICKQDTYVTSPRDFFYPDARAFKYLKNYLHKGGKL